MFDIDIELGQTDTPKSQHETEADRVEMSLRRWIMSKSESGKNIEKTRLAFDRVKPKI